MAIACIHYRKGEKSQAWEAFEKAASAGAKEALVYAVWARLLVKDGERPQALTALSKGIAKMPESDFLKTLRARVANKKQIDVKQFPQTYYQFWPEELRRQYVMRGRKGGPMMGQQAQPRPNARSLRRR